MRFHKGDTVRVDIPDVDDPDFQFHRDRGEVVGVIEDTAGSTTGDKRDSYIYQVELESGKKADFRWRDLRPVSD